MRALVTTAMIVVGIGLMIVSYTALAAPICSDSIACSEPRLAFAPAIFVLGLVVAFSSAIFYSVYKGSE